MATVPDTDSFSLQDVENVITTVGNSLSANFTDADANKFDPRYNTNGNKLSDFRNYGWQMDIGAQQDEDLIVSGALYDNAWIEAMPDQNWGLVIYGDSGSYSMVHFYVASTTVYTGYTASLSNSNVTDLFIVDSTHIYVADKYESGGSYYLRVRWYEIDSGISLVDTDTVSVSSTVYNLKDPKITAKDGYIWVTNFNNSTSTNYVYRMVVGTIFNTKLVQVTFSGTNVTLETLYVSDSILYLSQDTGSNYYIFSYAVDGSGNLTSKDSLLTTHIVEKFRSTYNTAVFGLSITNDVAIYITHDSDGDNLVYEDTNAATSKIDIDIDPKYNRPITCSSSYIIAYTIDGNDDLYITSNDRQCVQDSDTFTIQGICTNFNTLDKVVAFGYFDDSLFGTDRHHLFLFPVT